MWMNFLICKYLVVLLRMHNIHWNAAKHIQNQIKLNEFLIIWILCFKLLYISRKRISKLLLDCNFLPRFFFYFLLFVQISFRFESCNFFFSYECIQSKCWRSMNWLEKMWSNSMVLCWTQSIHMGKKPAALKVYIKINRTVFMWMSIEVSEKQQQKTTHKHFSPFTAYRWMQRMNEWKRLGLKWGKIDYWTLTLCAVEKNQQQQQNIVSDAAFWFLLEFHTLWCKCIITFVACKRRRWHSIRARNNEQT